MSTIERGGPDKEDLGLEAGQEHLLDTAGGVATKNDAGPEITIEEPKWVKNLKADAPDQTVTPTHIPEIDVVNEGAPAYDALLKKYQTATDRLESTTPQAATNQPGAHETLAPEEFRKQTAVPESPEPPSDTPPKNPEAEKIQKTVNQPEAHEPRYNAGAVDQILSGVDVGYTETQEKKVLGDFGYSEAQRKKVLDGIKVGYDNVEITDRGEPNKADQLRKQSERAHSKKEKTIPVKEDREPDEVTELAEQHRKAEVNKAKQTEIRRPSVESQKPAETEPNFRGVTNFKDLYAEVGKLESLRGTKQIFTPDILVKIINHVRANKLDLIYVTRTGGLREKVGELWEAEKVQRRRVIDNLSQETVYQALNQGKPIEVQLFNQQTNDMEEGWTLMGMNDKTGQVKLVPPDSKKEEGWHLNISVEQIKTWNSERNLDELFEVVNTAKDFPDLEKEILAYVNEHGNIHGSQQDFDARQLIDIITKVRTGDESIDTVTTSGGLRDKVGDLLKPPATPTKKPKLLQRIFGRRNK